MQRLKEKQLNYQSRAPALISY